ncbi:MAG: T9SS type A sorting domain-containing protein, partial [Lentimicrobiaceae bacterium]|nr:T9SS type A sorting domain-containing protein [Lentimicrobiaceae bacterium]
VWRKSLTDKFNEVTALLVTGDNHIIAAASKRLFKLDTDGSIIWQQKYGEANASETRGHLIREVTNGDLFLYGYDKIRDGFNTTYEPKLRIFSQNGEIRDSTLLPINTGSSVSYGNDYICIGNDFTSFPRNLLYRHDINGLIFQEKEILMGEKVRLQNMVENHEGNLVALGFLDKDVVLHCMTKEGDSLWTRYINNEARTVPMDMKLAADGGYVISYFFESNEGGSNPGLIKTDALGNISGLGFEESEINQRVKVYPNPAAEYVVFELQKPVQSATITITDITGRQVATIPLTGEKTSWQTAGLPSGVYLYRIEGNNAVASGKLVILIE